MSVQVTPDPGELGKRACAVEQVDDGAQDGAVEPGVLEGELLSAPASQADALPGGEASLPEHLLRGVDAPDAGSPIGESRGEPTRAAADVEDPPSATSSSRSSNQLESTGRSRS